MFQIGQTVYIKVSSGYVKGIILSKKGTYYTIKADYTGFGCQENRILTVEQYEAFLQEHPVKTQYRPPMLH